MNSMFFVRVIDIAFILMAIKRRKNGNQKKENFYGNFHSNK